MNDLSFVAVDIEATSGNPRKSRIIEVGAVKYVNGIIVDRYESLINPGVSIPSSITELTGISDDDVCRAKEATKALTELLDFVSEDVIVGHSIQSDYDYVCYELYRNGIKSDFAKGIDVIDTYMLAKKYDLAENGYSLNALCTQYGIINERPHRAYYDALATANLYCRFSEILGENTSKINHLSCKIKKDRPIKDSQKKYLNDIMKYHKIEFNVQFDKMTSAEAEAYIHKLRSEGICKPI